MIEPIDSQLAPEPKVKKSTKVIVIVLGVLGLLGTLCGIVVGLFYAAITPEMVPAGTEFGQMQLGGRIISGMIIAPGILLMVIAVCVWFFLWRKK